MTIQELKKSIELSLISRSLKSPQIRIGALSNLINLIQNQYPAIYSNPSLIRKYGKDEFKSMLAKHKANGRLNSAESSIINEFYYRII